jgi:hypothetical protein
MASTQSEVRSFAREFPTPNVLRAVELCEAGTLNWADVAALFGRSLTQGLAETKQEEAAAEYGRLVRGC